jgi:NAD(P)-dependent dehydrogenase (short-subunit alcohol dehydrogenase family)
MAGHTIAQPTTSRSLKKSHWLAALDDLEREFAAFQQRAGDAGATVHGYGRCSQQAAASRGPPPYSRSKLCNILFTRELSRRLHGTGVTANCLHPGFVATRFGDQSGGLISQLIWLAKFFAISPEKGAKTIVHLASSPAVAELTGKYFCECRPMAPSLPALDDGAAVLLWERSATLAGKNTKQPTQ